MTSVQIGDVSLHVEVIGEGYPLLLMHGGPGADHHSLHPFVRCRDRFTLIFYDHRCNGRSRGAPVTSMTWENLTADAEALRQRLGFERWAVLGHSFGGYVALEYALRYPGSLSHLVLLDTGGESRWALENTVSTLTERGVDVEKIELARRWFNGEFEPDEMLSILFKIGDLYSDSEGLPLFWQTMKELTQGGWRTKMRPEALIFAGRHLLPGWSVMDRLGEISVPTLIMAGDADFIFPPEHQAALAAGIPDARLRIVERAGHNPHSERTAEVMTVVREFIPIDRGHSLG